MTTKIITGLELSHEIVAIFAPMEVDAVVESFKEFVGVAAARNAVDTNAKRLIFDLSELRLHNRAMVDALVTDPMDVIPLLQENLESDLRHEVRLGFEGAFGSNFVTPRTMTSAHISKMVCCQGIVTSVSLVRPKIVKSVHYEATKKTFYQKVYRDRTMISKLPPTTTTYPTMYDNNILQSEYGLSEYMDFQTFILQEMPENAPPGQLPRSVDCIITEDLVDQIKPGDRVNAYGIYKAFSEGEGEFPTRFKTTLIVNHLEKTKKKAKREQSTIESIQMVANSTIKLNAVAPTIFGHNEIKKALALQMVGGNEIVLKNGTRIRGDINILLVGDPSTAKSQLLRYVMNLMPLTIATTGRGSTGVGLTAAVVVDKDTGDKRLEAGAMVLGDRGIVCIDEFDKMDESDRVAIHEVMEQQTVTIAKAGIHTTLNARCSVLAAANPIFGSYNDKISPQENVRLPESLMTRFDLVFITLDNQGVEIDQQIAEHVLNTHRGIVMEEDDVISQDLFREYILYAKGLRPKLSREAAMILSQAYTEFRSRKNEKHLLINITPRLLETMIRIATAHAKLRLSEQVDEVDANDTVQMIRSHLIEKIVKREVKVIRKETKVVEIEKKVGEAEKESSEETTVDEETKLNVMEKIWMWRDSNKGESSVLVEQLASEIKADSKVVRQVALELADSDAIMLEKGTIYFLD